MSENGRREGFNADERAKKREGGVVTIGDVTYHPARLTNSRLRDVRRISRNATREAREAGKETEEYREAYEEAIADGKEPREAEKIAEREAQFSEVVDKINAEAMARQLQKLLVDDGMQPPTDEAIARHVDEDLDQRDQLALLQYLTGEDPLDDDSSTSPTPSSVAT